MIFLEGRLPKYFFQEMCSSGGKQTIHKVSAAFIVQNCRPRTSLKVVPQGGFPVMAEITRILAANIPRQFFLLWPLQGALAVWFKIFN